MRREMEIAERILDNVIPELRLLTIHGWEPGSRSGALGSRHPQDLARMDFARRLMALQGGRYGRAD